MDSRKIEDYSPQTPGKLGRSFCPSEYESAGEGDISGNSLYYSICDDSNMSMNMSINKENAANGARRSIADLNASTGYRGAKMATPLLRKVLIDPSNKTPRNKNNKRVSFSHSPKPNPMPDISGKMAKMQLKESNEMMVRSPMNGSAEKKRIQLTPGKALKSRSLDKISETIENGTLSEAALTVANVSKHSNTDASVPDITETKMENGDSHFALNTTASSTDDNEKEQMHTTIIENDIQDGDQTLITVDVTSTIQTHPEPEPITMDVVANGKKSIDDQSKSVIVEKEQSQFVEPIVEQTPIAKVNLAQSVTAAMSLEKKDRKKSLISSSVAPPNTPNKSTAVSAADILNKVSSATGNVEIKNAAKLNRAQLANETRKSILPVAKKPSRPTVYKRRSGTFETRKVDRRATMARMSMVKSIASRKSVMPSATKPVVDKPVALKPNVPKPETTKKISNPIDTKPSAIVGSSVTIKAENSAAASSATREPINKPRMSTRLTTTRLSIYTNRQPPAATMNAQRIQRLQTKNFNNSAESSTTMSVPSTSGSSSALDNEVFAKPTLPRSMNNKPKTVDSKLPVSNLTFKCKYCDRVFAKNFGLNQHLSDNCAKIPASHRRLLLKDQTDKAESKTRKHDSSNHLQSQHQNDAWKHSRFFVEKFNQGVSASHRATKNMESGLSNLRNELKLLSNAHSGVKRTPKKAIKCMTCNKKFWDCVEYAIHRSNHAADEQQQQQLQQIQSQH